MRALIDTNIILDVCFERNDFQDDAVKLFNLIERKELKGCVSSTAITDIYYMAHKQFHNKEQAFWVVERISQLFKILKADEKSIRYAIKLHWKDFEDSVQYAIAKCSNVKAIITRNKNDYELSTIPIYTPKEFLELAGIV